MNSYQSPYERSRSIGALVKPIVMIIIILAILSAAAYFGINYFLGNQLTILRESFSEQEIKHMDDTYHIGTEDLLTPLYTFEQGTAESSSHYTGIVMRVDGDMADVLTQCFGQDADGEQYLTNYHNFTDYFVDDCYDGDTTRLQTREGKVKGIRCRTDFADYTYYFYAAEDVYYLMARRLV